MMKSASYWVEKLGLLAHPEGGYYKEMYRSETVAGFDGFTSERNLMTSIFFLLEAGDFSALHRIKSDELWHFYDGDPLEIVEIDAAGKLHTTTLGRQMEHGQTLFYVVKAGHWFGSRPATGGQYALVGCTVAPGFDFLDFEMPPTSFFVDRFPEHRQTIATITRGQDQPD